jgi:endonuclease/exonuclease/phosphatase family metal-dependent hydrolase
MTWTQLRWWVVLAGALCGVVGCSWEGPKGARGRDGAAWGTSEALAVLSYNIRHGRGTDGVLDLERIAGVVLASGAELVALQEVDERTERTGGVDQAAELGRLTGMHHAFAPFMGFQGGRYGLAVLSAHPILSHRVIDLPPGKHEPRVALLVEVELPGWERLAFVSLHLDWLADDAERFAQAGALVEALDDQSRVLLAGDFNDVPGSRTIRAFEGAGFVAAEAGGGDGSTFPAGAPDRRIDWIMHRPASAARSESVVLEEPVASDHRPVLARLWWVR